MMHEGIWDEYRPTYMDGWGAYKRVGDLVRCRDCEHSRKDGTLCMFFAAWYPIAGGDEYEETPADVEPDGFCKWGKPRKEQS